MTRSQRAALALVGAAVLAGGCASVLGLADPTIVGDDAASGAEAGDDTDARGGDAAARHDAGAGADSSDAGETGIPWTCAGDGGSVDGGGPAPSCVEAGAGRTNCGQGGTGTESCCVSPRVPCGSFDRSYDAVTYFDDGHPANVSAFRLDRYEATVGRFRPFVAAVNAGWLPAAGSGKHTHLNGGLGLAATPNDAGLAYEPGWDTSWNPSVTTDLAACEVNTDEGTWTATPGPYENEPLTYVSWVVAYAFCIWDGGFLPSEAEWNYAASAGSEQRAYAWSSPSDSTLIDCQHAVYYNPVAGCGTNWYANVGSVSPAGDGLWGQADLAGNLSEWTLDWYQPTYVSPCNDCANLQPAVSRVVRGGNTYQTAPDLLGSYRDLLPPGDVLQGYGVRCARAP
jgi:formylglycine-generating enzyme required for sulfatase activity